MLSFRCLWVVMMTTLTSQQWPLRWLCGVLIPEMAAIPWFPHATAADWVKWQDCEPVLKWVWTLVRIDPSCPPTDVRGKHLTSDTYICNGPHWSKWTE